jgi:hypothetical protein
VFFDGKYIPAGTWYDADDMPFQLQVHYFVGGSTKMDGAALDGLGGAALYRLRTQDFDDHPIDTPAGSCSTRLTGREQLDPRTEVLPRKKAVI